MNLLYRSGPKTKTKKERKKKAQVIKEGEKRASLTEETKLVLRRHVRKKKRPRLYARLGNEGKDPSPNNAGPVHLDPKK